MGNWTWNDTYSGSAPPTSLGSVSFSVRYSSAAQGSDQTTFQRNFQYQLQPINQPSALPIIFEGMAQVPALTIQGSFLTQYQFAMIKAFSQLPRTTTLTDDRGWIRLIYPSQFQYTRIPNALVPWKGSFQLQALVLNISYSPTPDTPPVPWPVLPLATMPPGGY
jgi:hypothetical protein